MSCRDEIVARGAEIAAAANRGDWKAATDLYTEDATLMIPDGPLLQGRESIMKFWKECVDAEVKDFEYSCIEVMDCGELAIDISTLTFSTKSEDGRREKLDGKYIVIWKKGPDSQWRLYRDIWNFDG